MVSVFRWDGGVSAVVKQSSCVDRDGEGNWGAGGGGGLGHGLAPEMTTS